MATLLLRLVGPMQSWGTTSRFDERDTGKEPSKSGVIGLMAAALGIERDNWADLEPLCRLRMGVRHDRPGVPKRDYQTAQGVITGNGLAKDPAVTHRHYLADAAFLVGLCGEDRAHLERVHAALADPVWPLALGRKSYVPSEPVWMPDAVVDADLREALSQWPAIVPISAGQPRVPCILSLESTDRSGLMKMDQPLSSFAERRFGPRFVASEVLDVPVQTGA